MLGFVVWHGAQWYVRRRVSRLVPSRGTAATAGLVAAGIGIAAVIVARRGD